MRSQVTITKSHVLLTAIDHGSDMQIKMHGSMIDERWFQKQTNESFVHSVKRIFAHIATELKTEIEPIIWKH